MILTKPKPSAVASLAWVLRGVCDHYVRGVQIDSDACEFCGHAPYLHNQGPEYKTMERARQIIGELENIGYIITEPRSQRRFHRRSPERA